MTELKVILHYDSVSEMPFNQDQFMNEGNLCETQLRPNLHDTYELTKTPGNDCRNYSV